MKYKFLPHTADIKFQAFGKSLEEAFENSALALKEIMYKKLKVKEKIKKRISVRGKDNERLLYDFLEEFLYLLDAEGFLLSKIKNIKITKIFITNKTKKINKSKTEDNKDNKINNEKVYNYKLIAEVIGDNAKNYNFTNNVKAITYNNMFVKQEKDKYICQVVVDV